MLVSAFFSTDATAALFLVSIEQTPGFMITRRRILLLVGVIVAVVVGLSTGLFGMSL